MNVNRINAADYAQIVGQATTIDLRTTAEYGQEKLESSISLPVQDLTKERFATALTAAGHTQGPVYLLCQSGRRAEVAVEKLRDGTTHELVIIDGGLNALKSSGTTTRQRPGKSISLERQVRIAAGFLTLLGVVLGLTFHPFSFGLSAFVGAGLMFSGITDYCGMALMLAHMPWNQGPKAKA